MLINEIYSAYVLQIDREYTLLNWIGVDFVCHWGPDIHYKTDKPQDRLIRDLPKNDAHSILIQCHL